ncbi:hypothetical protein [Enterobacter hormaechei]|uniref:hypothetical protein n=1 Tax=Enterobacter hormaechei TaxID=158836 RepID=UPI003524A600
MSTITRERAELKSFITGFLSDPAHDNQSSRSMTAKVFRIALTSLEAEPVYQVYGNNDDTWSDVDEEEMIRLRRDGEDTRTLYTAPPAPVSVPDELTREEYKRRFREEDNFDDTFRGGWNACRAALLQGADGNSPAIPDGYALAPVEPTLDMIKAGANAASTGMLISGMYRAMLAAAPQEVK